MKTKSRILAFVLTVLMVVGMLPLSLFALDEALPTGKIGNAQYVGRTQQEIQAEFDRVGMELNVYQSFNSFTPASFTALHDANNFVTLGAALNDVQKGGSTVTVVNRGTVYSIVGEGEDKALYYGNAAANDQAYFEINSDLVYNESIYRNFYFSVDIKMEGDTMPVAKDSILGVHIRPNNSPRIIPTVKNTASGELYVGEYSKDNVIGQLSKDTYTRIAIAIDRQTNKFYVYINDVLANPGGTTLFSQANVNDYNSTAKTNLTAEKLPINSFRALIIDNNTDCDGFYLDNLILGKAWPTTGRDTADSLKIQSDFSTAAPGTYPFSGNAATESFGTGYNYVAGGNVCTGAIVYIDETGPNGEPDGKADAIKYQKPTEKIDNSQAYVQYQSFGGQYNMTVSFDVKLGADGWVETSLLWHDIGKDSRVQKGILKLMADGQLRTENSNTFVGELSQNKYTNVRVDIIVDGTYGKAIYLFYLDNVLKAVDTMQGSPDDILHIRTFRIYTVFSNEYPKLKANDLQLKNIKFAHTSAYNNVTSETPFATNPTGFVKFGGILRYYLEDGSYMTEDFFIGTTKYMVGKDGEILSKEYAPVAKRSLADIQKEFATQGMQVTAYNTFDNWQFDEGKTVYNFASENTVIAAAGLTASKPVLPGRNGWPNGDAGKAAYEKAVAEHKAACVGFNASLVDGGYIDTTNGTEFWKATNLQNIALYPEVGDSGRIQIKNFRDSISIKADENGNKAMFINWAPETVVFTADKLGANGKPINNDPTKGEIVTADGVYDSSANNDVFIDIHHGLPNSYNKQAGNGTHDLFLSIDIKMNGKNIYGGALFQPVYRPYAYSGANTVDWISLSEVGGIYLGNNFAPQNLLGYLSQNEYTRIALATDRANNKFYVYINDVLVTPNGAEMFSQDVVNRMNKDNDKRNDVVYTAKNIPICSIRTFNRDDNTNTNNSDQHKGLWIDNILVGARIAVNDTTTAVATKAYDFGALGQDVAIDNPNAEEGKAGPALLSNMFELVGDQYKAVIGRDPDTGDGTIRWVDENGDGKADAVEWHWNAALDAALDQKNAATQAYFDVYNPAAGATNLRVSIDVKAGQSGTTATTLFYMRNGGSIPVNVSIDANGVLKWNKDVIGTVGKNTYTNVTLDYIRNVVDGKTVWAIISVGGEYKLAKKLTVDQNFRTSFIRVTEHYNDTEDKGVYYAKVSALKDQDIRVKAVSFGSITDYDNLAVMNPFEQKLEGLYGVGGIFRYYNGDGTFETEDFEAEGKKYVVAYGNNGSVIDIESLGDVWAPYAPYVDWTHSGTLNISDPGADRLSGSTTGPDRDGRQFSVTLPNGDKSRLFIGYKDTENGFNSPYDHSKYLQMDLGVAEGKSKVLDFDVLLANRASENLVGDQTLFHIRGGSVWCDDVALTLSGDGWIVYNGRKVANISEKEFARISFVFNNSNANTIDLYVNGVLVVNEITSSNLGKCASFDFIRMFRSSNHDFSVYYKDIYIYDGKVPQQFYTMVGGEAVLTSDSTKTPATAADLKQGFVSENGVLRYYDELGLPVIDSTVVVGGNTLVADKNGVVPMPCNGDNHVGKDEGKGFCTVCGTKYDGVSALYGHSLILGSDVKVLFYLDIEGEKLGDDAYLEIGLDRDYVNGTTEKLYFKDMTADDLYGAYVKATYAVSGKDICSDVTVRVVDGDKIGTEYKYSAAQYAEEVQDMTGDEYTEELKALAQALVVYGKNAAAVLADGEAQPEITDVTFDDVPKASGMADDDEIVTLEKISLELKSNIKIKVYFNVLINELLNDYEEGAHIVTVDGKEIEYVKVEELSDEETYVYVFEYEVVAAKLGTNLDFVIMTDDGSGLAANFSALFYAKIMAKAGNAAEKNLAKALKLYADAAAAYAATLAD